MKNYHKLFYLLLFLFAYHWSVAQNAENGKKVFQQNCAACHTMERKLVGPALKGVLDRWEGDEAELVKFIKNSQEYIKGDFKHSDYAKKLFEEYNKVPMTAFENLSDEQMQDLVAYLKGGDQAGAGEQAQAENKQEQTGENPLVQKGGELFKKNCVACHAIDRKVVGPALKGVTDRWDGDTDEIVKFIKNSQKYINGSFKHSDYAKQLFEQFNKVQMTSFEGLSDEDVKAILAYIEAGGDKPQATATTTTTGTEKPEEKGMSGATVKALTIGGFILALILLLAAVGYGAVLKAKREGRTPEPGEAARAVKRFVTNPYFIGIIGFIVVAYGFNQMVHASLKVGLHQGYQPKQPIAFSHKIHAGELSISCEYCHIGVENSKNATIPGVSICMNCHTYVQEFTGTPFGEYSKEDLTQEIKKVITAYEKNQPIEWIRIHNLPDFVYFSHAQHVKVGFDAGKDPNTLKETCSKCHGKVWEMDEVYQYSDLSMGFCVDCHRQTQVDLNKNDYYKTTHKNLLKEHNQVTVEELGGLNCARCHY